MKMADTNEMVTCHFCCEEVPQAKSVSDEDGAVCLDCNKKLFIYESEGRIREWFRSIGLNEAPEVAFTAIIAELETMFEVGRGMGVRFGS
jgi:hypothetical protein